jgi:hypothetical protein
MGKIVIILTACRFDKVKIFGAPHFWGNVKFIPGRVAIILLGKNKRY